MFLPAQTVLRPIGLLTQPSLFGQYPDGALAVARNVVMRNPGELVQAPDVQASQSVASSTDRLYKVIPLDGGHVYAITSTVGGTWSVWENGNAATFPVTTNTTFSNTGRITWARVAERLLLNSNWGYLVGDFMQPTSAAERALRRAGMIQPQISGFTTTTTDAAAIPNNTLVGYQVVLKRLFADGYQIVGVPSPIIKHLNTSGSTVNCQLIVLWSVGSAMLAGDIVEIYRSDGRTSTSWNDTPIEAYKRVLSYSLSSADIASNFVQLTDRQPFLPGTQVTPGEALYTNQGEEGEVYANRLPPNAKCTAAFKNFAFYAYTSERPLYQFSCAGGIGTQANAVAAGLTAAYFKRFGLGQRTGAGTIAIGLPTITGVSAADMVGIVPGQRWAGSAGVFAGVTTVVSAVGTTITMSSNALSNSAAFAINDVIEVNGTLIAFQDLAQLYQSLTSGAIYEITSSPIPSTQSVAFSQGVEFTIESIGFGLGPGAGFTLRATNAQNYSSPLGAIPEIGLTARTILPITKKNRIQWSKENQPEHCPSVSEDLGVVGEIYALNPTRDALFIWASDGLYRLSGDAGAGGLGNWRIDYINSTLILCAPQASTVLDEQLYGYCNVGAVIVDSEGKAVNLTDRVIGDQLPGTKYVETAAIIMERNETDEEILLLTGDTAGGTRSNIVYLFNTKSKGWTTLGSNGAALSDLTALAMQRSPASGEPRVLFGTTPIISAPSYAGWNSTSSFLVPEVQYRPIYGEDPVAPKQWVEIIYAFDTGSAARTLTPVWNGTSMGGPITLTAIDNSSWGRTLVHRNVGSTSGAYAQSCSPGFRTLSGTSTAARFMGLSVRYESLSNQPKKR